MMSYRNRIIFFLVAGMVAVGACAVTPQPGVIEKPGPDFQMDPNDPNAPFSCYTCHPNTPTCGNRVDCCTEVNPLQIQACKKDDGKVCFKKMVKVPNSPFYNVTRGCGKKDLSQPDNECRTTTTPEGETNQCHCIGQLNCNISAHFSVSYLVLALVAALLVTMRM